MDIEATIAELCMLILITRIHYISTILEQGSVESHMMKGGPQGPHFVQVDQWQMSAGAQRECAQEFQTICPPEIR